MTVVQTSNIGNTLQGSLGAPAVSQPVAPLVQNAPAGSYFRSVPQFDVLLFPWLSLRFGVPCVFVIDWLPVVGNASDVG